jgi:hypothetical protein
MVEEAAVRQHNRNVELTKEQQLEAKKVQVKQIAAGMISGTIAALATFGSRAARAAFILEKGYAIATAICNTALGVTKCLSLGYWGIPLAIAIGAMGAIQVAAIAASAFEGAPSTTPEVGTALPTSPAWPESTMPKTTPYGEEGVGAKATRETSISIIVQGNIVDYDKFARELLPAIRKAEEDHI